MTPRGEILTNYCRDKGLRVENTFYRHKLSHQWTWKHPNGRVRPRMLDLIVTSRSEAGMVRDFKVINQAKIKTDHRLVMF